MRKALLIVLLLVLACLAAACAKKAVQSAGSFETTVQPAKAAATAEAPKTDTAKKVESSATEPPAAKTETAKTAAGEVGKLVTTASGLQYIDQKIGTGKSPRIGEDILVNYRGTLKKDGKEFDSSAKAGGPAFLNLGAVIPGWQEGLKTMREGGKRKLIIPSALGYGKRGSPPVIGPDEDLVFEIELVKVGGK
jgi:peptidylprolyl isomerase